MKKLLLFLALLPAVAFADDVRITASGGHSVTVGTFGELLTGFTVSDVSLSFDSELNTDYDVKTTVTGDGVGALVDRAAQVSSTTGTARVESVKKSRYRAGHTGIIRFTAAFSGDGTGYAGAFDSNSGFFLQYAANVPSFCFRDSGGDTCQAIPAKTEDGLYTSSIDYSKLNIYEIQYGYLGIAPPQISIFTKSGKKLLTRIITLNNRVIPHSGKPYFPVAIESDGAMTVRSASWQAGTIGPQFEIGTGRPFEASLSGTIAAAGALDTLVNFKNSEARSSALTAEEARLVLFDFSVDTPSGNNFGTVQFKIFKNATLSGAGTYTAVEDGNSIMEYDTTVDYSSDGKPLLTKNVTWLGSNRGGQVTDIVSDAEKLGLVARPGDVFTITAQNVGAGTDTVTWRVSFNWEEF